MGSVLRWLSVVVGVILITLLIWQPNPKRFDAASAGRTGQEEAVQDAQSVILPVHPTEIGRPQASTPTVATLSTSEPTNTPVSTTVTPTEVSAILMSPEPTATPTAPPIETVVRTDNTVRGLSLLIYDHDDPAYNEKIVAVLDRAVADGVNTVTYVFPYYQDDLWSTCVYHGAETPEDTKVAYFLEEAGKRGLYRVIRPLMDEASLRQSRTGGWRGNIAPSDISAWFDCYTQFLNGYAVLAEQYGAEALSIGAEFSSLEQYTDEWRVLIDQVRSQYRGVLTYAVNFDVYPNGSLLARTFGNEIEVTVDAYFPHEIEGEPTYDKLLASWNAWVDGLTAQGIDPSTILVSEIGLSPYREAIQRPWIQGSYDLPAGTPRDYEIQSMFLDAACNVLTTRTEGVIFWNVGLELPESDQLPSPHLGDFMIFGTPAEREIADCFSAAP